MCRRQIILALAFVAPALLAQRHGGRSSPATAPPAAPTVVAAPPLVPVSSGLGAIQFVQVNYGVPAPQSLTRQLRFDDDRTRAAALSALGVPGQYLQHGHIPMPRSIDLELAPLGNNDDLDALLTIELDQHIVTAVLVPVDGNWRRIATLTFATPFGDASTTPNTWLHTTRSLIQRDRYRAIFHASTGSLSGDFKENEAHLRIINNRAVITQSFESTARECVGTTTTSVTTVGPTKAASREATRTNLPKSTTKTTCSITQRWFHTDPTEPGKRFELVTATGHIPPKDAANPLANSRVMLMSYLRTFSCQPFTYSDAAQHYEPSAPSAPCRSQ